MQQVYDRYKDNPKVAFLAIQTVFEGHSFNTFKKLIPTQDKYQLPIPMGHDDSTHSNKYPVPTTMQEYRSGGTPWVVIVDPKGKVAFNQFHIKKESAFKLIEDLTR